MVWSDLEMLGSKHLLLLVLNFYVRLTCALKDTQRTYHMPVSIYLHEVSSV
jgi:hypothetical protein